MAFALTTILCAGQELQAGDEIPVTVRYARRDRPVDVEGLIAQGLASKTKPKGASAPEPKGDGGAPVALADMSVKALRALAKDLDVVIPPKTKPAGIVELIEAAQATDGDGDEQESDGTPDGEPAGDGGDAIPDPDA